MLGFICPFEKYHTVFLILSLISITTSLLQAEILQISFNQALNLQWYQATVFQFFNSVFQKLLLDCQSHATSRSSSYPIQTWKRQEQKYKLKTKMEKILSSDWTCKYIIDLNWYRLSICNHESNIIDKKSERWKVKLCI